MRNACKILSEKTERTQLLGSSRRRWTENNTLELKVLRFNGTDWMNSLTLVVTIFNTTMNIISFTLCPQSEFIFYVFLRTVIISL